MRPIPAFALMILAACGTEAAAQTTQDRQRRIDDLLAGNFRWTVSPPLVAPVGRPEDPCYSVKDPTFVREQDKWHLFCTIRSVKRSHQIEYLSFADWTTADPAARHVMTLSDGYYCAPQVFYFEPHRKWYMILQVSEPTGRPLLAPAFSTTEDVADVGSWTKPVPLYGKHPEVVEAWIDFWVICDDASAHLFFTSNNGLMWRASTALKNFPHGWDEPRVVLRGDIFEASCTYKLKGMDKYLTIIEAEAHNRPDGWRYYKAYLADRLDGEWKPLADTWEKPFAGPTNIRFGGAKKWTDSISHGELLRASNDQNLEVDPADLRFIFQGVLEPDRRGKKYGEIPWRLGMLERSER
jgi:hypothetical protein